MSIDDDEVGGYGQLKLPGVCPPPILAERAFVRLATRWHAELPDDPDCAPARSTDLLALSCLQLAVDYGPLMSDTARSWMATNGKAARQRGGESWIDSLPWGLCEIARTDEDPYYTFDILSSSRAIVRLVCNLSHDNSSIRNWLMEIGWIMRSSLPTDALEFLFRNLADKLSGQVSAMGLAAALIPDEALFWRMADEMFDPPPEFEEQYRKRLVLVKEIGVLRMQAPFWKLESECRAIIEDAVLGERPVREH